MFEEKKKQQSNDLLSQKYARKSAHTHTYIHKIQTKEKTNHNRAELLNFDYYLQAMARGHKK